MHGEVYGDQSGGANGGFVQRLAGKVESDNFMAALALPGGRGHQSKRLPPELIRRNQDDVHVLNSITGAPPQGIVFGYDRRLLT
jgi:hypothetical protein